MKKSIKLFLAAIIVIMTFNISFSQETDSMYLSPRYMLSIINNHLVDATTYEFDIYICDSVLPVTTPQLCYMVHALIS